MHNPRRFWSPVRSPQGMAVIPSTHGDDPWALQCCSLCLWEIAPVERVFQKSRWPYHISKVLKNKTRPPASQQPLVDCCYAAIQAAEKKNPEVKQISIGFLAAEEIKPVKLGELESATCCKMNLQNLPCIIRLYIYIYMYML